MTRHVLKDLPKRVGRHQKRQSDWRVAPIHPVPVIRLVYEGEVPKIFACQSRDVSIVEADQRLKGGVFG